MKMSKIIELLTADLNLFEGGETGGTASDAGMQTGEVAAKAAEQSDAGTAQTEDRTETFRNMIKGEYKDLYDAEVQKIVKNRFKDMDNLQKQISDQQEIIDRMNAKYGIEGNDLKALGEAIDHDTELWESAADAAGMTPEQYVQFQNLERQNAQLLKAEQARMMQEQTRNQVNAWMEEANQIKEQFPEFNLEAELSNDRFQSMLRSGVPMEQAYKVMHFDELQNRTAQAVAAQTESAVTANIKAKGSRPAENGLQSQSAFSTHTDVKKLTKQDRADLAKRASRGETITFS